MNTENKNLKEETIKNLQFIIVYDKVSKPAAISLYNKVEKDFRCAAWSKDTYESNEVKLTNKNKRLFLVDSLIEANLQDPSIQPQNIVDGVILKVQGPMAGILIEDSFLDELLDQPYKEWRSFLDSKAKETWGAISFYISSPVFWGYFLISKWKRRNRARLATLFLATEAFRKKLGLKEFMQS